MVGEKKIFKIRDYMWDYPDNIKKYSPLSYIILSILILLLLVILFFKYNFIKLQPFSNDTYIEGVVSNSTYYNPYSNNSNSTFVKDINALIFSHLVYIRANGTIQGVVAKSWSIEDNSTKYVFTLRKNFKFQNGVNIDANDVYYSFNFSKKFFPTTILSNISAQVISKYKIEFLVKNLDVNFFQDINFNIVPQGSNYINNTSNIIGSGEYRLSYLTSNEAQLKRFNSYYLGEPHFKYFVIKIFKNYNDVLNAIKEDKIDGGYFPSYININISQYPNLIMYQKPLGNYYTAIFFNLNKVTNLNFRNALSYAISRTYLISSILKDTATQMYTSIPQSSWEYSTSSSINHYRFNPKKSANLLKGNQYSIQVYYLNSISSQVVNDIKKSWSNIGVSSDFIPENNSQLQYIISKGNYDAVLTSIKSNINSSNISLWYSKSTSNISKLSNSQIDQLLLVGISTINQKDRKETYALFQKDIQNIDPAIFLYSNNFLYIANSNIKGINFSNISYPHQRFYFVYNWYIG